MLNTSLQTNVAASNSKLSINKAKVSNLGQKQETSSPTFKASYSTEQLNNALKAYALVNFTGPRTTGKESGANINKIARKYGLNGRQIKALKEGVQAAKMGKAHHLTKSEVEDIARSLVD